jgi:hypothetical protein
VHSTWEGRRSARRGPLAIRRNVLQSRVPGGLRLPDCRSCCIIGEGTDDRVAGSKDCTCGLPPSSKVQFSMGRPRKGRPFCADGAAPASSAANFPGLAPTSCLAPPPSPCTSARGIFLSCRNMLRSTAGGAAHCGVAWCNCYIMPEYFSCACSRVGSAYAGRNAQASRAVIGPNKTAREVPFTGIGS